MKGPRLRHFFDPLSVRLAMGVLGALITTTAVTSGSPAAAAESLEARFDPCNVNGVERVVAVGDVHGAYDQFVAILRAAGIVDADGHWSGGRTHFVQTGDMIDRGPHARKVLDLVMRLEREAAQAGGRVYPLLGNHEVLAMLGDTRYTTPAEFEEFRTTDSETLRELYYEQLLADRLDTARTSARSFNAGAFRREFLARIPLGFVERHVAFGPTGEYGKWLRRHDTVVRINQVVFVHGGISLPVATLGCAAINERVRAELTTDIEQTQASQETSLVAGADGPLWYRGLAQLREKTFAPQLDTILATLNATTVVVGHSTVENGRVSVRFGGKVLLIDTGMLSSFYAGGRASALEIQDGTFTAIYPDGRKRLSVSGHPDAQGAALAPHSFLFDVELPHAEPEAVASHRIELGFDECEVPVFNFKEAGKQFPVGLRQLAHHGPVERRAFSFGDHRPLETADFRGRGSPGPRWPGRHPPSPVRDSRPVRHDGP
jgi:hypothetical protein